MQCTKKEFQLYFYKNETKKKEIDFIIQMNGKAVPIEVKSNNNRSNSLITILKDNSQIELVYKFIDGNIGVNEDKIITLPLCLASFLPTYILLGN